MSESAKKSKMSQTERARRRAEVGRAASRKVARSEQLNFRIEEGAIRELQDLAFQRGLPVSTMVHDWVLERLAVEKRGKPETTGKMMMLLDEFHSKLHRLLDKC